RRRGPIRPAARLVSPHRFSQLLVAHEAAFSGTQTVQEAGQFDLLAFVGNVGNGATAGWAAFCPSARRPLSLWQIPGIKNFDLIVDVSIHHSPALRLVLRPRYYCESSLTRSVNPLRFISKDRAIFCAVATAAS